MKNDIEKLSGFSQIPELERNWTRIEKSRSYMWLWFRLVRDLQIIFSIFICLIYL